MENRIDRKNDEFLYQPKIHSERIRVLYQLKQVTGRPMTVLVDQAIHELAERYRVERQFGETSVVEDAGPETWEEICEYKRFLDQLDYLNCFEENTNDQK